MQRFILVGLLACGITANARNWTLHDCINYALENNLSIKQSGLNVRQKEIELNTAKGRRLPGVYASGSQNFSFGRGLTADNTYENSNTTSTSLNLGAEIPIFQGMEINNGIKLGQLNLAAATEDLEKAKDDIRVAVAQAYVQILYAQEIEQVAERQVSTDSLMLVRLKAMHSAGKASSADVAAQQAALAQSRLSFTRAQNDRALDLLELTQLLELPSPEGFSIVSPDPEVLKPGLLLKPEDIYAEAVKIKADILSEKLRLDYAETNIKKAKGAFYPSLSLSGGLGTNFYTSSGRENASFGTQLKNNFNQYIGLSLNVPIFSRLSTRNSVESAKLTFRNQELQLENTKKALYKEIQQAYYNALASQSKLASSFEAASSAEQAYTLTKEKYENGKANVTEYSDSRNRYLEAESEYLQSRYECLYQERLLDFYRGKEMEF